MNTTANTKLLGVFGYPVGHTLSPMLHSFLADKTGTDAVYLAFSVPPDELGKKFNAAKELGAVGLNITVPHKIHIMEYIDVISPAAERIGAVNTVVRKDDLWYGYNTDGLGFLKSLSLNKVEIKGKNILMLGAGGSARAVSYTLAENGAKSVTITARTQEKADSIGALIEKFTDCKYHPEPDYDKNYDIIINTTPLGMPPHEDKNPFDRFDKITSDTVCCDLIYSPWETLFLKEAKSHGAKTINGFGMLVFQGIYAFSHFTDKSFEDSFYEETLKLLSEEFRK